MSNEPITKKRRPVKLEFFWQSAEGTKSGTMTVDRSWWERYGSTVWLEQQNATGVVKYRKVGR